MLELMKRREIVVSQDVPWGPIIARATTPEERGANGVAAADEPLMSRWSRSRDRRPTGTRTACAGESRHRRRPVS